MCDTMASQGAQAAKEDKCGKGENALGQDLPRHRNWELPRRYEFIGDVP